MVNRPQGPGVNRSMERYHQQPRKRHAQLRHQPRSVPLWAGDPEDWALVRRTPRPPLVCPEPGCDVALTSYENPANRHNPRIFKFKASGPTCDHWADRGNSGGPESSQHEWLKYFLTRMARQLGYTATPEHPPTRADVFVHEPSYCLEVQLRPTQFRRRTAARQNKGASVCWLIREGLDSCEARTALFRQPAVRFRIADRDDPKGRLLAPWDYPDDAGLAQRACLQVFGTVAHAPRGSQQPGPGNPESRWFRTGTMDGRQFLGEILSGHRRWCPPGQLDRPSGLWALEADVARYRRFRSQQPKLATPIPRAAPTSLPAPPPVTVDAVSPPPPPAAPVRVLPPPAQNAQVTRPPATSISPGPADSSAPATSADAASTSRRLAWWRRLIRAPRR